MYRVFSNAIFLFLLGEGRRRACILNDSYMVMTLMVKKIDSIQILLTHKTLPMHLHALSLIGWTMDFLKHLVGFGDRPSLKS